MKRKGLYILALSVLVAVSSCASATTIGEAKAAGPGWNGYLQGFVTAVFPDYGCMVIEEKDRSAAIVVRPSVAYEIGVELSAQGTIQSDGTFLQTRVSPTGFSQSVFPVAMSNKALTGMVGNPGVSNSELLVTTWGKVLDYRTPYPDGSIRFHISDGTALAGGPTVTLPAGGILGTTETSVFTDNFDTGKKSQWADYGDPTVAQNGTLVAGGTSVMTCVTGLNLQNAKVTVDATAGLQMGAILRYQDTNNFVLAFYAPIAGNPIIGFHEKVNGNFGQWINQVPAVGLSGAAHLVASVSGSSANLSITDGTNTYSTSCGLATLLGPGLVGLYHDNSVASTPVAFDNFQAFQLASANTISADAVQVTIPPAASAAYRPVPGNYVKVTGIAGKGDTVSGDLREVMISEGSQLSRIPVGGEIIDMGIFPPVVVAWDDSGDYGPYTAGTTTSGLQEAMNYCVSHGRNLYIRGPGVYSISTTLTIPAARRFTIEGGNYVIDWGGVQNTPDDCVVIDSARDCHYRLGLLVGSQTGTGAVIKIKPHTAIPSDGTIAFTDSDLRLECSTGKYPLPTSPEPRFGTGVYFDTSSGPITNNDFFLIAVINLETQIFCPDTGQPFAYNRLECGHLHTNANNSYLLHVGTMTYQNYFRLAQGVDIGAPGVTGVDIFGSNNTLDIGSRNGFPAGRELIFEPSAAGNQVRYMSTDIPLDLITDLATNPTNLFTWAGSSPAVTTVSASTPTYTYTQRLYPAVVRVTGGVVSNIVHRRSGGSIIYGAAAPIDIFMSPGDQLDITNSSVPTIYVIPM